MSPKIVDKEKRKKEIIDATLKLFSQKGYEATSMSQIAELAGIGKGTIYEYFESKEELILNAVKSWVEIMESEVVYSGSLHSSVETIMYASYRFAVFPRENWFVTTISFSKFIQFTI